MAEPVQNSKSEMMTKEGFYEWAEKQSEPYELIDGVPRPRWSGSIEMMAGETVDHGAIASNIDGVLNRKLKAAGKPCRSFGTNLGVDVSGTAKTGENDKPKIVYPDATVDCGYKDRPKAQKRNAVKPIVVFEVLSESNRDFDLGTKRRWYENTPDIQHLLYVEQDKPYVMLQTRLLDGNWLVRFPPFTNMSDVIELSAIGVSLTLEEIYEDVIFS